MRGAPKSIDRRTLLHAAAATIAAPMVSRTRAAGHPTIKAIAFDAVPVFDPRPIAAPAERLFPGQGGSLANLWRTRQFE